MTPYPESTEELMRKFHATLSEKDRRRYAAVEAQKLGHGGITYISDVLGCAHSTITSGMQDLESLVDRSYDPRVRQSGGGRKSYEVSIPGIDDAFLDVIENNTAGDPMQEDVLWTNLSRQEIAERLLIHYAIFVSETVVEQLLKKHKFTRRKAQKK